MKYLDKKNYDDFVQLLVAVMNQEELVLDNPNPSFLWSIAKFHSLESLTKEGFNKLRIQLPEKEEKYTQQLLYKCLTQDAEKENISEILTNNQYKHLPLKGVIIRSYYPRPEYRSMADIDILVEKSCLKKIGKLMKKMDYVLEHGGGNHDAYFKKPYMNIELHRAMIGEAYGTSSYYENIWSKVIRVKDTYEYVLNDEDYYIFMIAHAAKHFGAGGTGLRILLDLKVYLEAFPNLNHEYIALELTKLGCYELEQVLVRIVKSIFQHQALGENEKLVLEYLCECGTYGTTFNSIAKSVALEKDMDSGKDKYLFQRLFPPFKTMRLRNPLLKKIPVLLPWFWFTRLLKGLLHTKSHKKELSTMKNVDLQMVEKVRKIQKITNIQE